MKSRRLAMNEDRRRSTLTSTTGQLLTTQQYLSLEELMGHVRSGSLVPPPTLQTANSNKRITTQSL